MSYCVRVARGASGAPASAAPATLLASTSWLISAARTCASALALGVAREVGADGVLERGQRLEVADLAREGVVERRQLLALDLVQRDPHLPGLAPPALVGVVVGEPDLGVRRLARLERHDLLLEVGDRLVLAEHDVVGLDSPDLAVLDRGDLDPHHLARRGLAALDREPGGLLLPHPVQLLGRSRPRRTGATVRVKLKPPVRASVISGRTSTTSSNSTGPPSSNLRFRTEGSEIGLRLCPTGRSPSSRG